MLTLSALENANYLFEETRCLIYVIHIIEWNDEDQSLKQK